MDEGAIWKLGAAVVVVSSAFIGLSFVVINRFVYDKKGRREKQADHVARTLAQCALAALTVFFAFLILHLQNKSFEDRADRQQRLLLSAAIQSMIVTGARRLSEPHLLIFIEGGSYCGNETENLKYDTCLKSMRQLWWETLLNQEKSFSFAVGTTADMRNLVASTYSLPKEIAARLIAAAAEYERGIEYVERKIADIRRKFARAARGKTGPDDKKIGEGEDEEREFVSRSFLSITKNQALGLSVLNTYICRLETLHSRIKGNEMSNDNEEEYHMFDLDSDCPSTPDNVREILNWYKHLPEDAPESL